MTFRAAKQNRIFQDVVNQIQDAILSGELLPGDTLPSEREMREVFGTSRGTLREALRVLEQKGLIEIRLGAGGGAVVRDGPDDRLSESLDFMIRLRKISLAHLAEFREEVEGTVAAAAARRAGSEEHQFLAALLADARRLSLLGPAQWNAFLDVDKETHQALARIAGNPLYILINRMVHDNIHRYYDRFLEIDRSRMAENYEDLARIVAAVNAGRPEDARRAAREHVRRFGAYMERSLDGSSPEAGGNGGRPGP